MPVPLSLCNLQYMGQLFQRLEEMDRAHAAKLREFEAKRQARAKQQHERQKVWRELEVHEQAMALRRPAIEEQVREQLSGGGGLKEAPVLQGKEHAAVTRSTMLGDCNE